MTKRTQKVGVTGKYGTRYGCSVRKQIKKIEITQHQKYRCNFCGKKNIKRISIGIWMCKKCKKCTTGGAWSLYTHTAMVTRELTKRTQDAFLFSLKK